MNHRVTRHYTQQWAVENAAGDIIALYADKKSADRMAESPTHCSKHPNEILRSNGGCAECAECGREAITRINSTMRQHLIDGEWD